MFTLSGHFTATGHQVYCPSNCFLPQLLCFQKWKCQSVSKIWLCLLVVLQDPPFYFRIITSYLKMSGMPCIMNKKCKQWWTTIPSISTKQTTNSYINSLNIKMGMEYDVGNPNPGWDRHKNVTGLNRLMKS